MSHRNVTELPIENEVTGTSPLSNYDEFVFVSSRENSFGEKIDIDDIGAYADDEMNSRSEESDSSSEDFIDSSSDCNIYSISESDINSDSSSEIESDSEDDCLERKFSNMFIQKERIIEDENSRRLASFPDKPFFWMNDTKTSQFIKDNFRREMFYVMHDGKIIYDFDNFVERYSGEHLIRYSFHFRLRGGKGGFGSLLRSFRVNKSTNKLMMRDLNGRRLASVDEENKLKRYLEKQARKEQELKEKRKNKLAKLTAGPPKHQFEDQEYLSRREEIIEKTEDACEAGFEYRKQLKKKRTTSRKDTEVSDDENDGEVIDVDDLFNQRGGRKRKVDAPTAGDDESSKKARRDYEAEIENASSDSENESENEPDPEQLEAIRLYFQQKESEEVGEGSKSSDFAANNETEEKMEEEEDNAEKPEPRTRVYSSSNVDDLPKIDEKTPCEYAPINLDDYSGPQDLELLGLEHLKSALNERGVKCGGSLSERASRLWLVKGIGYRDYPKNILTPEMKRKIAEEEETEKKANKKSKKPKKAK